MSSINVPERRPAADLGLDIVGSQQRLASSVRQVDEASQPSPTTSESVSSSASSSQYSLPRDSTPASSHHSQDELFAAWRSSSPTALHRVASDETLTPARGSAVGGSPLGDAGARRAAVSAPRPARLAPQRQLAESLRQKLALVEQQSASRGMGLEETGPVAIPPRNSSVRRQPFVRMDSDQSLWTLQDRDRKIAGSDTTTRTASLEQTFLPVLTSDRAVARSWWQAITHQVDPKFIASVIDPRDVVLPMTPRRAAFFAAYAGAIVGLVFLDRAYGIAGATVSALRYQNFILMGFIYGLEPILLLAVFSLAKYPPRAPDRAVAPTEQLRVAGAKTEETAYVVPCYNSEPESLRKTVDAALVHFKPEQIFIVDNANASKPATGTRALMRDIDPKINYMWSPLGSKNFAQYVGSLAAKDYKYIVTTDDDVTLPSNFYAPCHLIRDKVAGVCLPIGGTDSEGGRPPLVAWQDLEYKMSGFSKLAEQRAGSALYPHGAGSFWERQAFLNILRQHDLIFFAEDCKLGLAAMKLDYQLGVDASQLLLTETPTTFLGKVPNWYAQRVRSWEMGRHIITPMFVKAFFSTKGFDSVASFALLKAMHGYALATNMTDFLRLPIYLAGAGLPSFWLRFAGFSAAPIVPALVYKYVKCRQRPDLAPSLTAVVTFPAYKFIYSAASILGAARALYFYWPSYKKRLNIPEMEKVNDPRCFYLDERFATDPGFLGRPVEDENREALTTFMEAEDLTTELAMVPPNTSPTVFGSAA